MKKNFIMILSAVVIVSTCTVTAVMPALADSDISSRGNIISSDGDAAFYSDDVKTLMTQEDELTKDLSGTDYISSQETETKNALNSKGIIDYDDGKVVFDSADLIKLADGIDNLNSGYKYEAVSALNTIHTYLKEDGTVAHEQNDETVSPENADKLSFSQICTGILKSQSVEHLADQNILPASEENLSEGSAAWVDGVLLIGSGEDNKNAYEQGYEDGMAQGGGAGNGTVCYYLGRSNMRSEDARGYSYNIPNLVPEVDHTQLSSDNFVVCPYIVQGDSSSSTKYLSTASDVKPYCKIEAGTIVIDKKYDTETGYLTVWPPVISASGGLSSMSGYSQTAKSEMGFKVYLIIGSIEDREKLVGGITPGVGDIKPFE